MRLEQRIAALEQAARINTSNPDQLSDRQLTRIICGDADRVLTDEDLEAIAKGQS